MAEYPMKPENRMTNVSRGRTFKDRGCRRPLAGIVCPIRRISLPARQDRGYSRPCSDQDESLLQVGPARRALLVDPLGRRYCSRSGGVVHGGADFGFEI